MSDRYSSRQRPSHEEPPYIDMVVGPDRDNDNRRFGQMLADYRQEAGLSRDDAAAAMGISAEYLRLVELGRRTPAMGQMHAFLEVYGIEGAVGKLQPGGDRPDLILFPHGADEPVTLDFASRIRGARRRGTLTGRGSASEPGAHSPADIDENRAIELGRLVARLATADIETLRKIYELLEDMTPPS